MVNPGDEVTDSVESGQAQVHKAASSLGVGSVVVATLVTVIGFLAVILALSTPSISREILAFIAIFVVFLNLIGLGLGVAGLLLARKRPTLNAVVGTIVRVPSVFASADCTPHGVAGVKLDMRHTFGSFRGILWASGPPTGIQAARFGPKTGVEAGPQGRRFRACRCDADG